MDTTETITHVGLCAGYGGIELGLKRVLPTLRTVALCEIEAFACANLVAKMEAGLMDPAPIWTDLKTFPYAEFRGRVDILTGGYPCQPFSSAGKRAGKDDPRHLWPWIAEGIRILKPTVCLFENVEGHITLGLSTVVSDLEEMGYKVSWGIFSASEVGAPHQRKRVFIMANRIDQGSQRWLQWWQDSEWKSEHGYTGCGSASALDWWPSRPGELQHAWEPPRVVEHAAMSRCSGQEQQSESDTRIETRVPLLSAGRESVGNASSTRHGQNCRSICNCEEKAWISTASVIADSSQSMGNTSLLDGSGQAGGQWQAQAGRASAEWDNGQAQSSLGGDTDGPASGLGYAELCESCDNRTDELRLLGNGVVPATATLAFRTLLKELAQ